MAKAFLIVVFFILASCTHSSSWRYQEIISKEPAFQTSRLDLIPEKPFSEIGIELVRISHKFSGNSNTLSSDLDSQHSKAVLLEHCPCHIESQSQLTEDRFPVKICEKCGLVRISHTFSEQIIGFWNVHSRTFLSEEAILWIDGKPIYFKGTLFKGRQRLLLPQAVTEALIKSLLQKKQVVAFSEGFFTQLSSEKFLKNYNKLVTAPGNIRV